MFSGAKPRRLFEFGSALREAGRGLRNRRGTIVLAFVILSLTMTAATVMFSIVDTVVLRPLPYGAPDRLLSLTAPSPDPARFYPATPQDYFAWLEGTRAFEGLAAARFTAALELELQGTVHSLITRRITTNLFDVLQVRPQVGRFFGPEHERPGGPPAVILSHDFWVRIFRADPAIVGRTLAFADAPRQVIGVLPAGVVYPITLGPPSQLYIPYVPTTAERDPNGPRLGTITIVGRLRPDVTIEQARADANRIASAVVVPLHDQVVGPAGEPLILVLAAVGLVVLVACVNVGCLLLARATARAGELATRLALGASRRRLAGTLLLEGLVLALASAGVAIVLSFWAVGAAKTVLPPDLIGVAGIAVDGRVLSAVIAAAVVASLVFSTVPAWLGARTDLVGVMKTGRPIVGAGRHAWALTTFLVADVAFVSVLLVATTLVVTSFVLITTADLGFDRRNVVSIWYQRPLGKIAEADQPAALIALRAEIVRRTQAVRGVSHVALISSGAPLSGADTGARLTIPGFGVTDGDDLPRSLAVTSDYFALMGIKLLRGRTFTTDDTLGAAPVIILNDVAARRFFGTKDPIGELVSYRSRPESLRIVGIVGATRPDGPDEPVRPEIYVPLNQRSLRATSVREFGVPTDTGAILVRTHGDVRRVGEAVREAIRPALGGVEPGEARLIQEYFDRLTADRRFNAALMTAFGVIAICIGGIGVFGTMAFVVARQTRAIGLRIALGATPAEIRRAVLSAAARRAGLGAALGVAGAWAISRAFSAFVFGIRPTEPLVYVGVAIFVGILALTAALVPAIRASRVDPLTALRTD